MYFTEEKLKIAMNREVKKKLAIYKNVNTTDNNGKKMREKEVQFFQFTSANHFDFEKEMSSA